MASTDEMQTWWQRLDDTQRDVLRQGNKQFPMATEATQILFDTDCPALPDGATNDQEGFTMGMPAEVAEVINWEN